MAHLLYGLCSSFSCFHWTNSNNPTEFDLPNTLSQTNTLGNFLVNKVEKIHIFSQELVKTEQKFRQNIEHNIFAI